MDGWLNVMSLVLGLVAWILPVVNLMCYKKRNNNWVMLSLLSVSACAIALYGQIAYHNHLVEIEDWSALLDTSEATVLVSKVLLVVTLILNALTLFVYRGRVVKSMG